MITAALGFAMIENLFIASGVFDPTESSETLIAAGGILLVRFVGATLLHVLTAGVIGFYWAKGMKQKRIASLVLRGIIFATLIHAIFNHLVLRFEESNLLYASVFLIIASFFVFQDFEKLKHER